MEIFERTKRKRPRKRRKDRLSIKVREKKAIYKEQPHYVKSRVISENNYLKNYAFVRDYVLFKYKLKERELLFFMFLYNEPIFDKKKLEAFCQSTLTTRTMFDKLKREGYITIWYDPNAKGKGKDCQYELSSHTKSICAKMYGMLNFEEKIITSENMRAYMREKKGSYFYSKYLDSLEGSKRVEYRSRIYLTSFRKK